MQRGTLMLAAAALLTTLGTALPPARAEEKPAAPAAQPKTEFVYLELTGVEEAEMPAVVDGLARLEGVRTVAWTSAGKELKVVREVGKPLHSVLTKAALAAGAGTAAVVPIAAVTLQFDKVLHCGGCVKKVTGAVLGVPGTKEAIVAESLDRVTVVYDSRSAKPQALLDALAKVDVPSKQLAP